MTGEHRLGQGNLGRSVASAPAVDDPATIRATVDGELLEGTAIDLRPWSVTVDEAAAAVCGRADRCAIACPRPGSLFESVGIVEQSIDVALSRTLATVARRRGQRVDTLELRSVRSELAALSPPSRDFSPERRQVADVGHDEAELAERVASIRGELAARREADVGVAAVEERLSEVVAALTSVRTERLSAQQALDRAREDARSIHDRRDRRLRLQDRERNLARTVRRDLADAVYDEFAAAVRSLSDAVPGRSVPEYDGDDVTAALALLCMLRTGTPVVLAVDRFPTPERAASDLGVPVVRV